jgi:hypothetical protein
MNALNEYARLAALSAMMTLAAVSVAAQSSRIENGVTSRPGFDFFWETRLEPPSPPLSGNFGTAVLETASNVVHRVMLDRSQKVYFGYAATVEAVANGDFRLTFAPLPMTQELRRVLGSDAAEWKPLPTPRFPPARLVRGGDVLELPLLTSSGWGQRLTEYVSVREPRQPGFDVRPTEFAFAAGTARDFRVEDVELRLDRPTVSVRRQLNETRSIVTGERVTSTGSYQQRRLEADVWGRVVWIYIPGQGRYLLSLVPDPTSEGGAHRHAPGRFQKAGEVRGSTLRFSVAGANVSVSADSRIAPGDTAFNLYVLHEPKWVPEYPQANRDVFQIGSAAGG